MAIQNQRVSEIISRLKKEYPGAKTALRHADPLQLLIATVLSAQCTDERVNMVTERLFKKYRSVKDYAGADLKEFEGEIRSTGFYKNKARNIIGACKRIVEEFKGRVPDTMEALTSLPGVGRKTANLILSSGYGIVVGIVVDTHVRRLSQRLGLTKNDDPEKIEEDLMKLVHEKDWEVFSHLLIWHGRRICQAKKPLCPECIVHHLCPSYRKFYPKA